MAPSNATISRNVEGSEATHDFTQGEEATAAEVGLSYSMTCGQRVLDPEERLVLSLLAEASLPSPPGVSPDSDPAAGIAHVAMDVPSVSSSDSDELIIDSDGKARWDIVERRQGRRNKRKKPRKDCASSSEEL